MNNHQLSTNNYQLLEGYQQTEVGVIPEDWEVYTIGETVTLINGRAFKPSDWAPYGLPIIRIQNLNDPIAPYNYYEGAVEERYYVNFGDILFAWSGTKESSFGARMWRGQKAILNQHIFRVVPNEEKLSSQYVLLALKRFQEDIERKSHGFKSSFVHIRKSDLENTHLAIPPLEEQRSIAQALSDVDRLIAALEKAIAKKRAIKTATMQQLLTGKKRLPGFGEGEGYQQTEIGVIPEDWEVVTYGEHFNIISGLGFKKSEYTEYGAKLLRIDNVSYGEIAWDSIAFLPQEYIEKYKNLVINQDDILLALNRPITNGKLKIAVAKESDVPAILYQRVGRIIFTSQKYDKHYAFYLLSKFIKQFVEESSVGSDQPFISTNNLKKYKICLPLEIEEQRAIATVLSDMDAEIAALETRLAKTRSIKQGMMQQLLTGKVRLKIEVGMDAGREDD